MMNSEILIVSLTSYPKRIHCVYDVLISLLNQTVDRALYHVVLVLCSSEFPNGIKDVPENIKHLVDSGDVEIIWHPTNIRSHKKLIPTLKKYPNDPILVVDDDSIRDPKWIEVFLNDHKKYPNDIIGGNFAWFFGSGLELSRLSSRKRKCGSYMNGIAGMVLNFAKPANGDGGCLYPAGTFTDSRFFDENLFMKLSPTSDESWQFCFNIIENRTFRQTSVVFDASERFIEGTQEMPTALHRVNNYTDINKRLFSEFPEFKSNLLKRQRKIVVSLTTYGNRLKSGAVDKTIQSILNQSIKPSKIVLNIDSGDEVYFSDWLKDKIKHGVVELISTKDVFKPHKKYFYVMQKYRDYAIITFDDDQVYSKDAIKELFESYLKHPDCVSARRVHLMKKGINGKISSYSNWTKEYTGMVDVPSDALFATGVGGVLYPPDILGINDDNIKEIEKYLNVDDIYLKVLEQRKGIKVVKCKTGNLYESSIVDKVTQMNALQNRNVRNNENDLYLGELVVDNVSDVCSNVSSVISKRCASYWRTKISEPVGTRTAKFTRR